jgi:hypothetical protein
VEFRILAVGEGLPASGEDLLDGGVVEELIDSSIGEAVDSCA